MNKYPNMFSPMTIRNITFRNRVMAAPMTTARIVTESRCPTSECIDGYEIRARGGVGAVTVTETFVDFDRGVRHDHSIDFVTPHVSVHHLESLFLLAEGIKAHGAVASVQFNHIGEVNHPAAIKDGKNPIGPTGYIRPDGIEVEEMDEAMMNEVADNFANAVEGAQAAGFEMVMIHGGHGWLLGQFISPLSNKRTDEYGGSMENRAKFPIMVLDRIRQKCPNILIEYRVSGSERVEGGLEIEECVEFAKMIEDKVDLIHVTSGLYGSKGNCTSFTSIKFLVEKDLVLDPCVLYIGKTSTLKDLLPFLDRANIICLKDVDISEKELESMSINLIMLDKDVDIPILFNEVYEILFVNQKITRETGLLSDTFV